MKYNGKSVALTLFLLLALALVIVIELSLFISGPTLAYDDKITKQEAVIKAKYEAIDHIDRHVFSYIIYSGSDQDNVYWFNELGELLTQRAVSSVNQDEVLQKVQNEYGIEGAHISYGYGYENPVYVVESKQADILLDIDTLKQIFYRKKG